MRPPHEPTERTILHVSVVLADLRRYGIDGQSIVLDYSLVSAEESVSIHQTSAVRRRQNSSANVRGGQKVVERLCVQIFEEGRLPHCADGRTEYK